MRALLTSITLATLVGAVSAQAETTSFYRCQAASYETVVEAATMAEAFGLAAKKLSLDGAPVESSTIRCDLMTSDEVRDAKPGS